MLIKLYSLRSWRVVRRWEKIYGNLCQKVAAIELRKLFRLGSISCIMNIDFIFQLLQIIFFVMYGLLQNVSIWIFRAWISFHFFLQSPPIIYGWLFHLLHKVWDLLSFFLNSPLICWFSVANWIYYFWLFYFIVWCVAIKEISGHLEFYEKKYSWSQGTSWMF